MLRALVTAPLAVLVALVAAGGCAEGERAKLPEDYDAGPPQGFKACQAVYFASYLKTCTSIRDCSGVLTCDLTRTFAEAPRCHVRRCELDSECELAFESLCLGDDFHYACIRANPLVPQECRLVEGPRP
jgi:hypothetical protein